jgi:hypothetical protein
MQVERVGLQHRAASLGIHVTDGLKIFWPSPFYEEELVKASMRRNLSRLL